MKHQRGRKNIHALSTIKVDHLKALLKQRGVAPADLKTKKSELLSMYWDGHVDIQFTVSVGMKVGRYFGDDLYIGEVRSIDNDDHTILYEDGDEEIMDTVINHKNYSETILVIQ